VHDYWKLSLSIKQSDGTGVIAVTTRGWQGTGPPDHDDEASWDNARLIAAAPRLIEVLRKLMLAYEVGTPIEKDHWFKQGELIIADVDGQFPTRSLTGERETNQTAG
jgi:hypothetical protein